MLLLLLLIFVAITVPGNPSPRPRSQSAKYQFLQEKSKRWLTSLQGEYMLFYSFKNILFLLIKSTNKNKPTCLNLEWVDWCALFPLTGTVGNPIPCQCNDTLSPSRFLHLPAMWEISALQIRKLKYRKELLRNYLFKVTGQVPAETGTETVNGKSYHLF